MFRPKSHRVEKTEKSNLELVVLYLKGFHIFGIYQVKRVNKNVYVPLCFYFGLKQSASGLELYVFDAK